MDDGAYRVFAAARIVNVGVGQHGTETSRFKKWWRERNAQSGSEGYETGLVVSGVVRILAEASSGVVLHVYDGVEPSSCDDSTCWACVLFRGAWVDLLGLGFLSGFLDGVPVSTIFLI